jgi:hypothetical protein
MELLGTFDAAHAKVLQDAQRCLEAIQRHASRPFNTAAQGVQILRDLRRESYEELNQIQHEHLIIHGAEWLVRHKRCNASAQWHWNPRQTGDATEPDLRGVVDGKVVVSAEVTASQNPVGVIDTRMHKTLAKLAHSAGERFYFVSTPSMLRRAQTKVRKNGWPIEVVLLDASAIAA